jgi:hypothetical protein
VRAHAGPAAAAAGAHAAVDKGGAREHAGPGAAPPAEEPSTPAELKNPFDSP